ncbi:MAG: PilW family protein [Acidiferrobacterales bacterium]
MKDRNTRQLPHAPAPGFSMVELMVAMAIGIILMIAVVQIFSSSRGTYQLDEGLSRLQENARFAMEALTHEIRMAGSMGCIQNVPIFNNLDSTSPSSVYDFSTAIQGFEYNGTGIGGSYTSSLTNNPADTTSGWTPALDPGLIPGGAIPGTDVIVVRHISAAPYTLANPTNDSASVFLTPAPAGTSPPLKGQIAIITNCQTASLFQITSINASGTTITHAASGTPGNSCVVWGSNNPGCAPGNQIYGPGAELDTLETYAFYIGQGANKSPSLFEATLVNTGGSTIAMTPQELVNGVENMQILYGVDTSGNANLGPATSYMTAADVASGTNGASWAKVVTVRLSLLLRTTNTRGTATDVSTGKMGGSYYLTGPDSTTGTAIKPVPDFLRRRVFNATIELRNRGT